MKILFKATENFQKDLVMSKTERYKDKKRKVIKQTFKIFKMGNLVWDSLKTKKNSMII